MLLSVITVIATLVLVGWQFNIDVLKAPVPYLGAMSQVSAILFIAAVVSFILLTKKDVTRTGYLLGKALALLIILIASVKLISFLSNENFKASDILYFTKGSTEKADPISKQLAPITSACFILTGLSMFFLNIQWPAKRWPSQFFAIIIHFASAFSVMGYLYHVRSAHDLSMYNPMALYSAVCFILFSLVILFAMPRQGMMKQFTSIHAGSITARILIPTALLLPLAFGVVLQYGSWLELYSPKFSIVLFVLTMIMFLVIALWYNAVLLNKRDVQKAETEKILRENQDQIQAIFRSAPDAVIVTNENGKILQWNRQAELLFGWTSQETLYKHLGDLIIPSEFLQDNRLKLEHFIRTGKKNTPDIVLELKSLKKNGTIIDISISISSSLVNEKIYLLHL
jgi:PAS domain S-box-containing protein